MPDKIQNTNGEELMLATAEGDWFNNIALLLILALTGWTFSPDSNEDAPK